MWLLRASGKKLELQLFNDENKLPKYAILSHCWLDQDQEVLFEDIGNVNEDILAARSGWAKVNFTREQAVREGLDFVWIDTCCIDKKSSAELAEAINSMYRWYKRADACYTYLEDLRSPKFQCLTNISAVNYLEDTENREEQEKVDLMMWNSYVHANLPDCRIFKRGWTLQEMLAPVEVNFYSADWTKVGTRTELADVISIFTKIHVDALRGKRPVQSYSIAQRMSWAAERETSKVEDQAYSLLGLFDVNMPVVYGEGKRAFARLQEELLIRETDQTIFAWQPERDRPFDEFESSESLHPSPAERTNLLADSPAEFKNSGNLVSIEQHRPGLGQMYELAAKYIQLDAHINSKDSKERWAVLRCCPENDYTKVIALRLEAAPEIGPATFFASSGPRICSQDIYDISEPNYNAKVSRWRRTFWRFPPLTEVQSFKIVRHLGRPLNLMQESHTTILCRIRFVPRRGEVADAKIVGAEPQSCWDTTSSSITTRSDHHEELILSYPGRNGQKKTAKISPHGHFGHEGSSHFMVLHRSPHDQMAIDFLGGRCIIPVFAERQLVHETVNVLEIRIEPLSILSLLPALPMVLWTLFSMAILPGILVAPIVTIHLIRQYAYTPNAIGSPTGLTTLETRLLEIGLPISASVSLGCLIFSLMRSGVFLTWRPRSWILPTVWSLMCVSTALCIRYLSLTVSAVEMFPARDFPGVSKKFTSLTVAFGFRAFLHCLALSQPIYNFIFKDCMLFTLLGTGRFKTVGQVVLLLVCNVATLIPATVFAVQTHDFQVPVTTEACKTRQLPSLFEAIVTQNATSYPASLQARQFDKVCTLFAEASTFLWVSIAIAYWELFLQILALGSRAPEDRSEDIYVRPSGFWKLLLFRERRGYTRAKSV